MTTTEHRDETTEDGAAPDRGGATVVTRLQRALQALVPPEIWSQPRPSLRDQLAYARHAMWGPRTGVARGAAQVWFWAVSLPTSAMAYYWEWLWERPSRALAGLPLMWLAAQTPPGQLVLTVLGTWLSVAVDPISALGLAGGGEG